MFSRSRNPLLTFILSYHVRVTSKIQVNFRYRRSSKVLMILSYKLSKFLQYLCFRGQEIHCWHSYWATMFRVISKIQVNFRYRRYWWFCLMDFWNFFNIYVFEVKESIAGIPTELPCSGYLGNPGQLPVQRYSKVLMIVSDTFLTFLHYSCFRGQATEFWHFYRATMFGWPQKSRSTSGSGGTDDSVLWIFEISLLFRFSRSRNPLLIFLLSYLVWVTSKIWVNFRFQRFSRSPNKVAQ